MDTNRHEIVEQVKDFPMQWIFAQYELGRPVSEIAAEMKISENRVYAKMRSRPKTYEEIKKAREEMYCRRLRRVRGLADSLALDYLKPLAAVFTQVLRHCLDITDGGYLYRSFAHEHPIDSHVVNRRPQ